MVSAGNCSCSGGKKSHIYAIGTVSFDFGTEARRDSFRQLMPLQGGVPANPYDPIQLCDYLDANPAESTKLIWTLNLDLTPIYAIEAEGPYASEVYTALRSALRGESLRSDDPHYISNVSISGDLTYEKRQLFSGQVVPVVVAQLRGLYTWNEAALINAVIGLLPPGGPPDPSMVTMNLRNFLARVYYELRNLGQSSPDRALNFSATNIFQAAEAMATLIHPTSMVATLPIGTVYTFDNISVSKSPFGRMDSDCWDVQLTFFDPLNVLAARMVAKFTIDVSDAMPVSIAPLRFWAAAPTFQQGKY